MPAGVWSVRGEAVCDAGAHWGCAGECEHGVGEGRTVGL